MKNKTLFAVAFVIVVGVFTLLMIILVPKKDANFVITLIFTILAITGYFSSILFLAEKKFKNFPQNFPFVSISWKYLLTEILISILFMVLAYTPISVPPVLYLLAQTVILAIFAIVTIVFLFAKRHIEAVSEPAQDKRTDLQLLSRETFTLADKSGGLPQPIRSQVQKELRDIYETLKYSDPMSNSQTLPLENRIRETLAALDIEINRAVAAEAEDIGKILGMTASLRRQIRERNDQVRFSK